MENIEVCVRVKPRSGKETDDQIWKSEGNRVISLKSKEAFTFGNKYINQ
jgi:hypothetical protein